MNIHDVFIASELAKENGGGSGGGLTQAEVEKIVTDEVAKIVAGAPEDFDTLKEMSDWISQHEESAAAMNSAISDNTNAIADNIIDIADNKNAIADNIIDIADNKNAIQTNRANIATNKTNILTLAKHVSGDLTDSDFSEDSTAVMVKTVPSGMADYAAVKSIGGKTVKTKNLFSGYDKLNYYTTSSEKYNGHDCITSEKAWGGAYNSTLILKAGKTYCISAMVKSSAAGTVYTIYGSISGGGDKSIKGTTISTADTWTRVYAVYAPASDTRSIRIESASAVTTTISEFMICESDTLIDYESYFEGLHNAAVESVVSTSVDGTTKTTLLLPDSDRNLPCFGYGIDETLQNIRDYENGTYTQMVTELRLGDIDKSKYTIKVSNGSIIKFGITIPIPYLIHNPGIINPYTNLIANNYDYNGSSSASYNVDESDGLYTYDGSSSASGNKGTSTTLYYLTHDITKTIEDAMNDLADTVIVFELATPVVTDCSDMLHPIRVETGGTITFQNEHGLDVPNTVVYKKEVSLNG